MASYSATNSPSITASRSKSCAPAARGRLYLATGSTDKTGRIWEIPGGRLVATLQGHQDGIRRVQFSADGKRVVTASYDNSARVWDVRTGKLLATLTGHEKVQLEPHWVPTEGVEISRFTSESDEKGVTSARFSPDGMRIITTAFDNTARVWNATTGDLLITLRGPGEGNSSEYFYSDWYRFIPTPYKLSGDIFNADFGPDGQRIFMSSWASSAVRVWDANTGQFIADFQGHRNGILNARFSANGRSLITASLDATAQVWDLASKDLAWRLEGHQKADMLGAYYLRDEVLCTRFSPDGRFLVTSSGLPVAKLWDVVTGRLITPLDGHAGAVTSARFSPDGQRIVTASRDNSARIWDARSGRLLQTLKAHQKPVVCAEFSPDSQSIVTASQDATVCVWKVDTGHLLSTLRSHSAGLSSASFSSDSKLVVASCDDGTAQVWDVVDGKLLATLVGHKKGIWSAKFSSDDRWIVTAALDDTVRVWNRATGQLFKASEAMRGLEDVEISPDGSRILVATRWDHDAELWTFPNCERILTLQGHRARVFTARFNSDGSRIITTSEDKTARVWDAATGKVIAVLPAFEGGAYCANFSPDERRIVIGTLNDTVRLWEAPRDVGQAPEWFASFLESAGDVRLDGEGNVVSIPPREWLQDLGDILRSAGADRSGYGEIAQWLLLPTRQRPVRPGSEITQEEAADKLITADAVNQQIQRAYDLYPTHPLIHLALARFETNPTRAAFLCDYSLNRLPDDAALWSRAAEILQAIGDKPRALRAADKALSSDPKNERALKIRREVSQ